VCSISFTEVKKAARILDSNIKIISLEPESISDILENLRIVGKYTGKEKVAEEKIGELEKRIALVQSRCPHPSLLPKGEGNKKKVVLILEWLDPIMVAGHWVPEMIEIAGGISLVSKPGERSREISWNEVVDLDSDILI